MKLLFDENLAPRLVDALADAYPDSCHVHQCGLGSADDLVIWEFARVNGFTIVSKDSDFHERSVLFGHPPKTIWLRATNCTSSEIEALLRAAQSVVERFVRQDQESCLILGQRAKSK